MMEEAEPAEPVTVALTVSFILEERFLPAAGDREAEPAEEHPQIEGIYFLFELAEPFGISEKSEPFSTVIPGEPAEGEEPAEAVDWPSAVNWSHAASIAPDEVNSKVETLQQCCRIATVDQTGDEELGSTNFELGQFLLGAQTMDHIFSLEKLGRVRVTLTLDKPWLSDDLAGKLLPMAVTVQNAEALPNDHLSFKALAGAFNPVHCEYRLFEEQPLVSTQALPHGKKLAFKHTHIFHAGDFATPEQLHEVIKNGFIVRVHDRQYDNPNAAQQPAEADEADAEANTDAAGEATEDVPDPAENLVHLHCGEAKVRLAEFLEGEQSRVLRQRATVMLSVNREEDIVPSTLTAVPGYMESASTVSVKVATGFSVAALQDSAAGKIDATYTGPFHRSFYIFKYNDVEFFAMLTQGIQQVNGDELDLPKDHKMDVCALKTEQDVLTGFQLADGNRRMFYVEGPKKAMDRLSELVPRKESNSDTFKVFRSEELGFKQRLFERGTMKLPTYRLCDSLTAVMLQPEVAQIIRSKAAPPQCVRGLARLWSVRQCDYLREVARMELWPTKDEIASIDHVFGDDVKYEDVFGEPKPVKTPKRSALQNMQEQEVESLDSPKGAGWKHGYYQKSQAPWTKWHKTTERTDQLDVGSGGQNAYFATMLSERRQKDIADFNDSHKAALAGISEANASLRPPKRDVSDLLPDDGAVFMYSSQTLNTAELQKEVIRQKLASDEHRDKFFTYSKEYMSLAMCRVNEPALGREAILENKRRWKTEEGFLWPAPKDPALYNRHPKQLSEAAREELTVPWVENVLHPKPVSRDTAYDPSSGKPQWDNITRQYPLFEKNREFFNSVFAPAALGLTPEQAEELLKEDAGREAVLWREKLVVDSPNFKVYFRNTMRKKVHPLERLETFLKDEPDKRRRALSKRGRGRGAIKQAPISMLAGEPYEDPRDFTLDLKVNEPLENVVEKDFDRYSGLNEKVSLMPHNIHCRPPRGELSEAERANGVAPEESRRRILGMGGLIEPIFQEERSSFLFNAKVSKPGVKLPPIGGSAEKWTVQVGGDAVRPLKQTN